MSTWQLLLRLVRAPSKAKNRPMLYLTIATTSFQLIRRVTASKPQTLLTFEVKDGETYEIVGVRR